MPAPVWVGRQLGNFDSSPAETCGTGNRIPRRRALGLAGEDAIRRAGFVVGLFHVSL